MVDSADRRQPSERPGSAPADTAAQGERELKKEGKVSRQKRFAPEQIIAMLREADVRLSHGERVAGICSSFGISEQSYYRWRRQYGGLRIDQAQKMKRLERENARLRRVLSSLSVGSGLLGQGSNKD